ALWRASASAATSRSMPTTRRECGATASAIRPAPVPTSRTFAPASGSAHTSDQNCGLTPDGGAVGALSRPTVGESTRDGTIGCARHEARVLGHDAARVARLRLLQSLETLFQLGRGELDVE